MRRSQLEMCIDILKVLACKGPIKLASILSNSNVNCSILKEQLSFLIKQDLVEERKAGKRSKLFAVTQRGINVLTYFRELPEVLPFVEEEHRNQTNDMTFSSKSFSTHISK